MRGPFRSLHLSRALCLCLGILLLVTPSVSDGVRAQQTPGGVPTLQATSRLVFVDVIARDKHGKAVEGLTQADFQVSEHLKAAGSLPQRISFFREVDLNRDQPIAIRSEQQASSPGAGQPRDVAPPTILLLDALNTNLTGQRNVLGKLPAMIDAIPPGAPAALYVLGGQLSVLQGLTSDHALLRQAAERAFPPHAVSFSSLAGQSLGSDPNRRYMDSNFTAYASKCTSEAFQEIAKQLVGVPGRKNLIWVSDSFPSSVPANGMRLRGGWRNDQESFTSSAIEPAVAALSAARVAVYSVLASTSEPMHLTPGDAASGPVLPSNNVVSDPGNEIVSDDLMRTMRQATMQVISDQTGGIACTNVSDLRGCVAKAMDHGSRYYEIAYYPISDTPGVHGVVVHTERPGVTLTYPQSYDTVSGTKVP